MHNKVKLSKPNKAVCFYRWLVLGGLYFSTGADAGEAEKRLDYAGSREGRYHYIPSHYG